MAQDYLKVLLGIICFCGVVSANLDSLPLNDAVVVGSTVTLHCSTADPLSSARVMWTEFASSTGGRFISDNKTIVPSHPEQGRYSLTGSDQEFNLEIRDVQLRDGGTYLCQDINSGPPSVYRGYAELVVLERDPECVDFVSTTGIVIEDNTYSSECELKYQGNIVPAMTWTGPGTFLNNGSATETSVWSWIRFTAFRDITGRNFACRTNFTSGSSTPGHATNIPSYEYIYAGPTLIVSWGPKNMEVTPIKTEYIEGDVLTCIADSSPESTYVWTNMRTLEMESPGQTFTIRANIVGFDQVMRCHAEVLIDDALYTQDIFVNVSVPAITTPTTSPTTQPSTIPPDDAPCNDLSGRWSSTNPDAIICLEVDTKGNLLTLIRNGTDPYFVSGNGKTVYGDYKHIGFTGVWPSGSGVAGFSGECHRCKGTEVILLSGLSRNKAKSPGCGESAGTELTKLYVFTRSGPPCRGTELNVFNPNPWQLDTMGIHLQATNNA